AESEYGFDIEDNYCSPEQQLKDIQEQLNSKEYIDAMTSLKAEMEKECPELFTK
ncbi:Hypothetical predicted protein, partial [Paramuricea clavata]